MFNILDIRHILVALSFLLKFYLHFFVFGLHCCNFFPFKYTFVSRCQTLLDVLGGSDDKESACNAVDLRSIPRLGRSPGKIPFGSSLPSSMHCASALYVNRSAQEIAAQP